MGGVEADFETPRIGHTVENLRDLTKMRSKTGSLPGSGFKRDAHLQFRMLGMETIEISYDTSDARLHSSSQVGAGMEHKRTNAELLAAEHFVGEGA